MQKQTSLIADDSELNRAFLADMLAGEYEIIEAGNGLQGAELLRQKGAEISLVLLDGAMPEMDGFGLLEAISQNSRFEHIPVIFFSASADSALIQCAFALGAADVVPRPFNALLFRRRMENTIKLYTLQRRLAGMAAEENQGFDPQGAAQNKE